jgi:hypothetical protein
MEKRTLANAMQFALASRAIAREVASRGLLSPTFRCPPRLTGADRTLRRRPDGSVVIAIRVTGRPFPSVLHDMIDGVMAAQPTISDDPTSLRRGLWLALANAGVVDFEPTAAAAAVYRSAKARVA